MRWRGVVEPAAKRRLTRRELLGGLAGTGAAALIPARRVMAGADDTTPIRGGFPLVALAAVPQTLDPARATQPSDRHLASLLYASPLRPNTVGGVNPSAAIATIASADGLSLTMLLRPDLVFHDGTPVRSRDVVASLERLGDKAASGKNAWRMEHVSAIDTTDEDHVTLRLRHPDVSLPATLAADCAAILPTDAFRRGDPFASGALPPGTGPFMFNRWESGGRLNLHRSPGYWRPPRPYFDGLLVSYLPEEAARTSAMLTLAVDVIEHAPLLDIATLKQDTRITLVGGPSRRICALGINTRRGEMADVRLRRLLADAIDRAALVKAATADQAIPSTTLFPDDFWGALKKGVPAADSGKVKRALTALGYPAGLSLSLLCPERDASLANAAVLLQEQCAQAGIALTLQLLEVPALGRTLADGDYDLVMTWQGPWLDPHELVRPLLASDGVENTSGYANPVLDRLIDAANLPADQHVRAGLYREIQETMLRDFPWIVLFHPNQFHATVARMEGFTGSIDGSLAGLSSAWFSNKALPPPG